MRQARIDYGRLVEGALRSVVRDVLTRVSREGLPAPHHFYVTFRSEHPGVVMPEFLRERYPTDMTIVLQHQFWDLAVTEHTFEVGLSFGGVPERLLIPFSAVKGFFDPSVQFGLQFEVAREADETAAQAPEKQTKEKPAKQPKPTQTRPRGAASEPAEVPASLPKPAKADEAKGKAGADKSGADVVSLDAFRKKT